MPETALRIDKLLFFLRIAKSRSLAQGWAESGYIRVNGRRIEKGSATVSVGDVITMPRDEAVVIFKLLAMPVRRGPAAEAMACYQMLG
ncbi:RNA-binding S4 domain-containing protein [Sphingorhabdus sp. IMCC26285]|uniref:RNA-binding S4 domain-containing protein n=1 Tax=Sphingorhabdus profundilacus TaxID=2509718 RepID=A0A6I4LV80_9SPHN|nr:S4 domain-containing protein [Sphingorhabdus profundilacus]MVZ97427.1 RNA-binding S4 domain-containing protein [Sphingorhabdus profundilacus]